MLQLPDGISGWTGFWTKHTYRLSGYRELRTNTLPFSVFLHVHGPSIKVAQTDCCGDRVVKSDDPNPFRILSRHHQHGGLV